MNTVRDLVAKVSGERTRHARNRFASLGYAPLPERITSSSSTDAAGDGDSPILRNIMVDSSQAMDGTQEDVSVVQWAAPMFFCREDEQISTLHVMRIGPLHRTCSVRFKTIDGSAKGGVKYEARTGVIEFAAGEDLKAIEIKLIEDANFDTTLQFRVALEEPQGCVVNNSLSICRTLIDDDDIFPDNRFGHIWDADEDELNKEGVNLLISNLKFCFLRVPEIKRMSIFIVAVDQLQNLYYLMTVFLRVYLIDVVLNIKDPETEQRLWVPGNRSLTVVYVALLWTLPHIILMLVERLKVGPLFMEDKLLTHYRVNLFRKYLNYKAESREQVPVGDLVQAMGTDIPEVVRKGYLSVFPLLESFGKLCCVAFFICSENLLFALPLLIYPAVIFLIEVNRRTRQLHLEMELDKSQSKVRDVLIHVSSRLQLISNYKRKQWVVDEYERHLAHHIPVKSHLRLFQFWANQIIPLLTLVAIGSYIVIGSASVLSGKITIGTFLATLNVYKDFGDRFEEMYAGLRKSLQAVEPLVGLVRMLNLETDVPDRMTQVRANLRYSQDVLQEMAEKGDCSSDRFDKIPIKLNDIAYPPLHRATTAEMTQGHLVQITGDHGTGKTTLCRIIAGLQKPESGSVLVPAHLQSIHVDHIPVLADDLSLWENLTFGTTNADPGRVLRIVERLGLSQDLLQILKQDIVVLENCTGVAEINRKVSMRSMVAEALEQSEHEIDGSDWHKRATAFDKKRLHWARAFIYSPQIMIVTRPVDDIDLKDLKRAMSLLREFVENRGVELDAQTMWLRRPCTAIFTVGESRQLYCSHIVDKVWHLDEDTGLSVKDGQSKAVDNVKLPSRSLTGKFGDDD